MNIHIKWDSDKYGIQLPVLPESFSITGANNNETVVIHDFGEVNLLGDRGLYSVELSSFFPHQKYDFCKCEPEKPYVYCKKLKKLKDNNTVCHLVITETNINMQSTIEELTWGEEDGSGDVSYTILFKEYRKIKKVKVKGKVSASKSSKKITLASGSRLKKKTKSSYTWKKGDTFQSVSKKLTGTSANWRAIYNQNKKAIEKKIAKKKLKNRKFSTIAGAIAGLRLVIKT